LSFLFLFFLPFYWDYHFFFVEIMGLAPPGEDTDAVADLDEGFQGLCAVLDEILVKLDFVLPENGDAGGTAKGEVAELLSLLDCVTNGNGEVDAGEEKEEKKRD